MYFPVSRYKYQCFEEFYIFIINILENENMRRKIFKYLKFHYFFLSYTFVELIILILVNFILEKSFTYCTNVHSYFEKGNNYIYTYKSQCFKKVFDFMLGHTHCSAGPHARVGQPCSSIT